MPHAIFVFCAICAALNSFSAMRHQETYLAKVVDFVSTIEESQQATLFQNIKTITNYMQNFDDVDIVVYPEYALTGPHIFTQHADFNDSLVNIPNVSPTPLCRENVDQAINDFACASERSYTVINMLEKSASNIYSTNVVFNPQGAIVAKYRKINLSGVEQKYLTPGDKIVTFETDFKVKFGVISADDILHKHPGAKVLDDRVTDVLVSSALTSEMPFRISVSIFDGYAKKYGVNVIAAGYADPKKSCGGSGIFTPTFRHSYMPLVEGIKSIRENVDVLDQRNPSLSCNEHIQPRTGIIGHMPDASNFITTRANIDQFTRESILSKGGSETTFNKQLCQRDFCCKFSISFNGALYNLAQDYQVAISDEACGLMACEKKDDASTCGSRHPDLEKSHFDAINIEVSFKNRESYMHMPVSSDINLTPLKHLYCEDPNIISISAKGPNAVIYIGFIRSKANNSTFVGVNFTLLLITTILSIRLFA